MSNQRYFLSLLVLLLFVVFGGLSACEEDPEVKYQRLVTRAAEMRAAEKFDEARISLSSAIALKPKVAENYFELAEVLIRQKRFPEAIENYRTTLNLAPEHREARLHLAALMLVVREYEKAESDIRKLLEANPQDYDALVLSANLSRSRNDFQEARKILTELLETRPDDVTLLANLGDLELAEGRPKEAEEYFAKALRIAPENDTVRLALADLYSSQGRVEEAQSLMEDVLKTNVSNTTLRLYFGEFLLGRGQTGRAREQFEEMLRIDPLLRDTRDRLFDMYLAAGERDAAEKLTTDLKEIAPDDPALPYFEGRVLELNGKRQEALEQYLKTIRVLGNFAPAFRRAGLVELLLGKTGPGHEHLNQAVVINPVDVGARLALARSAFLRQDFGEAQGHVAKILERYPRHLGANVLHADIFLLQSDTKRARGIYEALVNAFPNNAMGYLKLGLVEEKEQRWDEAIGAYEKYLSFDKDILVPGRRLARLYARRGGLDHAIEKFREFEQKLDKSKGEVKIILASMLLGKSEQGGDLTEVRRYLTEAIEAAPNLIAAYAMVAQLDAAEGNYEAAIKRYEELLQRDPKHIPALMLIGINNERLGHYEKAAQAYRRVIEISPDFAPAKNNLAWLLAEHVNGNLDEALSLALAAKAKLPSEPGVADTLGWIYHKRGQSRAALELIQEAIQLQQAERGERRKDPEILYHLGTVRLALGEKEGAVKAFQEALQVEGVSPVRHEEMTKLIQSNT